MKVYTKEEAIAEAKYLSKKPVVASCRMVSDTVYMPFKNWSEAINWINFNRDWMYPGSDRIERVYGEPIK